MSALRSSAPLGAVNAFSTASAARSHFASRLASRTTSSTRTCTTRYFSQSPAVQAQSLRGAQARCIQSQKPSQAGLQCSARTFSSTTKRHNKFKTVQQAEARHRTGPFSWKAGALFILTGIALSFYFKAEKARIQRKKIQEQNKGVGRPRVGGPFELVDQNGNTFTSEDMKGKFALVYFGFTHCPDICPEELDKMVEMVRQTKEKCGNIVRPLFISCDPARDTPQVVKVYLEDFSSEIVGLTGSYDAIKQVCKDYRVYFSTPPHLKAGQDYLVDHSIYFYLMDPDGDFVEALGRHLSPADCTRIIEGHLKDWKGEIDKS